MVLGDGALVGLRCVAGLHQLEQLEAAGAAQRADHLAGGHRLEHVHERGRDFVHAAPAQITAIQRVGAVGITHGRGVEVHLALVQQGLDAFDLLLAGRDLLGGGTVRQGDQDMRQVILLTRIGLHRQRGVHFALADLDLALGEALAQALHRDFIAQRIAEVVEGHAILGQPRAQRVDGHAVLLGDRGDRAVDLLIADLDAAAIGAGDLQLHQDQALHHLPFQHLARRQLAWLAGILVDHVGDRAIQFALQDDVLIHDRGNPVQRLEGLGGQRRHAGGRQQDGGEGTEQLDGHGSISGA